jgi:tetratricopeptide (TPR) repeat protein
MACIACIALAVPPAAIAGGARDERVMAQRVSAELKAALVLSAAQWRDYIGLIRQERFAEFEAYSLAYEEKFKTDPKYETVLITMYGSLEVDDDALLKKLNTWVAKRPSHISHAARGIYMKARGFYARGSDYSSETAPEKMQRMAQLHRQAIPDLLAAVKENGRFAPAYIALIDISRAVGDTRSAERVHMEAVRLIPQAYYVRYAFLTALNPRWGGDYALMQAYADSLDQAAALNPRIWSLKAEVSAEMGHRARAANDPAQAIKYFTEALRFGDRLEFLWNRGRMYMAVKDYDRARADFAKYVEYSASPEVIKMMRSMDGMR